MAQVFGEASILQVQEDSNFSSLPAEFTNHHHRLVATVEGGTAHGVLASSTSMTDNDTSMTTVTIDGEGSNDDERIADLQEKFSNIRFKPAPNFQGVTAVTLTAYAPSSVGSDYVEIDRKNVEVLVEGVNDAPKIVLRHNPPYSAHVKPESTMIDFISISDSDGESTELPIQVTVSMGTNRGGSNGALHFASGIHTSDGFKHFECSPGENPPSCVKFSPEQAKWSKKFQLVGAPTKVNAVLSTMLGKFETATAKFGASITIIVNDMANGSGGLRLGGTPLRANAVVKFNPSCGDAEAPVLELIKMSNDGRSLEVLFDRKFHSTVEKGHACGVAFIVRDGNVVRENALGFDGPERCESRGASFFIYLGKGSTVLADDSLEVKPGFFRPCVGGNSSTTGSVAISFPDNPVEPTVKIEGSAVLDSCDDLILRAKVTSGFAGREGTLVWSSADRLNQPEPDDSLILSEEAGFASPVDLTGSTLQVSNAAFDFDDPDHEYTIALVGTNFMGVESVEAIHTFKKAALPVPTISITNGRSIEISRNEKIMLSGKAGKSACGEAGVPPDMTFSWSSDPMVSLGRCSDRNIVLEDACIDVCRLNGQNADPTTETGCEDIGGTWKDRTWSPGGDGINQIVLPNTLSPGMDYKFTLTAAMKHDPDVTNSDSIVVRVANTKPSAKINGNSSSEFSQGVAEAIILDATDSKDPDNCSGNGECNNSNLSYAWSCFVEGTQGMFEADGTTPIAPQFCDAGNFTPIDADGALGASSTMTVASNVLDPGSYRFILRVTHSITGLQSEAFAIISLTPGDPPLVSIDSGNIPITSDGNLIVSSNEFIVVSGIASPSSSSAGPEENVFTSYEYIWHITNQEGTPVTFPLDSIRQNAAGGTTMFLNRGRNHIFAPGDTLTFKLTATPIFLFLDNPALSCTSITGGNLITVSEARKHLTSICRNLYEYIIVELADGGQIWRGGDEENCEIVDASNEMSPMDANESLCKSHDGETGEFRKEVLVNCAPSQGSVSISCDSGDCTKTLDSQAIATADSWVDCRGSPIGDISFYSCESADSCQDKTVLTKGSPATTQDIIFDKTGNVVICASIRDEIGAETNSCAPSVSVSPQVFNGADELNNELVAVAEVARATVSGDKANTAIKNTLSYYEDGFQGGGRMRRRLFQKRPHGRRLQSAQQCEALKEEAANTSVELLQSVTQVMTVSQMASSTIDYLQLCTNCDLLLSSLVFVGETASTVDLLTGLVESDFDGWFHHLDHHATDHFPTEQFGVGFAISSGCPYASSWRTNADNFASYKFAQWDTNTGDLERSETFFGKRLTLSLGRTLSGFAGVVQPGGNLFASNEYFEVKFTAESFGSTAIGTSVDTRAFRITEPLFKAQVTLGGATGISSDLDSLQELPQGSTSFSVSGPAASSIFSVGDRVYKADGTKIGQLTSVGETFLTFGFGGTLVPVGNDEMLFTDHHQHSLLEGGALIVSSELEWASSVDIRFAFYLTAGCAGDPTKLSEVTCVSSCEDPSHSLDDGDCEWVTRRWHEGCGENDCTPVCVSLDSEGTFSTNSSFSLSQVNYDESNSNLGFATCTATSAGTFALLKGPKLCSGLPSDIGARVTSGSCTENSAVGTSCELTCAEGFSAEGSMGVSCSVGSDGSIGWTSLSGSCVCGVGTFWSNSECNACADECSPGYFETVACTATTDRSCSPCAEDMYQDEGNQSSCNLCPSNSSNRDNPHPDNW
jgi:hypothetical protein